MIAKYPQYHLGLGRPSESQSPKDVGAEFLVELWLERTIQECQKFVLCQKLAIAL